MLVTVTFEVPASRELEALDDQKLYEFAMKSLHGDVEYVFVDAIWAIHRTGGKRYEEIEPDHREKIIERIHKYLSALN